MTVGVRFENRDGLCAGPVSVAERALRSSAVGGNNYYWNQAQWSGESAVMSMSILQTATKVLSEHSSRRSASQVPATKQRIGAILVRSKGEVNWNESQRTAFLGGQPRSNGLDAPANWFSTGLADSQ